MATVRCWALHGNINNAVYYVLDVEGNGAKTENKYFECTSGNAYSAGYDWKISSNKARKSVNDIVGFHFQQSFETGSISPDEAFEISKRWIEEITGGEYDYVLALHTDTKNIHSHIIINPINKITGKTMNIFYKRDLPKYKQISDRICVDNGLSILNNTVGKGKSYYEWMMENKGDSLKQIVAKTLDNLVERVSNYDELKKYLQAIGYDIQDGLDQDENFFEFTGDIKLIQSQGRDEKDYELVRLPYTKEFIRVSKDDIHWIKENKTFHISYSNSKSVDIFDIDEHKVRTVNAEELNLFWEKKNNSRRKGLRIKIPGSSKFIRCNRIVDDMGKSYSLSDIIKRIDDNGRLKCDQEILDVISKEFTKSEINNLKGKFFDQAEIKMKWANTSFYKTTKKERYIAYKTNQIQKKLDAIHSIREVSELITHLDEMKTTLSSLQHDFKNLNKDIKKQEKILEDLQTQKMENILDITQDEIDEYIADNITPLYATKKNMSEKMRELSEKIKTAENVKKEKNKKIER